ncbi:hypothetical protein MPLA_30069 [Mesorhizobium sp. ORS 3359]|nr:hypothetical protein MPLA_30069 [Mesorhizobium sp. ORS 3359]
MPPSFAHRRSCCADAVVGNRAVAAAAKPTRQMKASAIRIKKIGFLDMIRLPFWFTHHPYSEAIKCAMNGWPAVMRTICRSPLGVVEGSKR